MHTVWCYLTSLFTSNNIITLATVVYAGVTIVMFRAIRSQAQAAHRQADIAERAAKAAEKSADAAKETIEITISKERARFKICVKDVDPQSQRSDGQIPLNGAVCWLMNYGLSTAFVCDFRGRFCQSDAPDIAAEYAQCKQVMYAESIPSHESSPKFLFLLEPNPTLADDDILRIRTGKSFLHFYGFVKHRDVYERVWQTTIHVRWKMRLGGVIEGTAMNYWEPVDQPEENDETREKNAT